MARTASNVSVEVKADSISGDFRRLQIEVSAKSDLFNLSDLLVKEKAISDLESLLKISARRAVADYILSGKQFLKSAARKSREETTVIEEEAGQDKRSGVNA